jgi:DNA polymerase-3 subunit delta'
MAFSEFTDQKQAVMLLQRSLARGRLAHAYLFTGGSLDRAEEMARTLAKTLNCLQPSLSPEGLAVDCCDTCLNCRKTDHLNHADVQWIRPEMKTRVIGIDQIRDLLHTIHLKPTEAGFKIGIVVAADRLNATSGNAFLKTLEEPPPKSILILLSTEPQQMLETILSRCLRLHLGGESGVNLDAGAMAWVESFGQMATGDHRGVLGRYRLLGHLFARLGVMKGEIEKSLTARSPLNQYDELDAKARERLEDELSAAIEAEYRRRRADLLAALHWWLRDIWLVSMGMADNLFALPKMADATRSAAQRLNPTAAAENLREWERTARSLNSNVQEALALEVGFLKLHI